MKKWFFIFLCIVTPALAFGSQLVPDTLEKYITNIIDDCMMVSSVYIACPQVQKYSYPSHLSIEQVKKEMENMLSFTLKDRGEEEAISVLLPRIQDYQRMLSVENNPQEALYKSSTDNIITIIRNMSHSVVNATYIDDNIMWVSSIFASAVVVINPVSKKVYVFIIGDVDG